MAWATKFWSFGGRTQRGSLIVIAQQLSGYTEIVPGLEDATKFQSGFLLASYDMDDWRLSVRGSFRHEAAGRHQQSLK